MTLSDGKINITYIVEDITANDEGIKEFLFSLGCYPGECITIISKLSSNYIVNIKDARYTIDNLLAKNIKIKEL